MLPRLCTSGTVVCLATGPSLTREDVDWCHGRATVIAVNDAWQWAPWADVLYSSDRFWWQHYRGVPEFQGIKVSLATSLHGKKEPYATGLVMLNNTGEEGLETSKTGLRTYRNSGGAAINLAVHLGARRILLLGYDMGIGPDGQEHFFGAHPQRLQRRSPYAMFCRHIATMVKPLKDLGIEVINCSRRSALTCFPRGVITQELQEHAA